MGVTVRQALWNEVAVSLMECCPVIIPPRRTSACLRQVDAAASEEGPEQFFETEAGSVGMRYVSVCLRSHGGVLRSATSPEILRYVCDA